MDQLIKIATFISLALLVSSCAITPTVSREVIDSTPIEAIEISSKQEMLLPQLNSNASPNLLGDLIKIAGASSALSKTEALNEGLGDYDFMKQLQLSLQNLFPNKKINVVTSEENKKNRIPRLIVSYELSPKNNYIHVVANIKYKVNDQTKPYSTKYVTQLDLEKFGVIGKTKEKYRYLLNNPSALSTSLDQSAEYIALMIKTDLSKEKETFSALGRAGVSMDTAGKWGRQYRGQILKEQGGLVYLGDSNLSRINVIASDSRIFGRLSNK